MPLETQQVELQFEGLAEKANDKSVPPVKLTRAENVEFDKFGAINKRRGYRLLPLTDAGSISSVVEFANIRAGKLEQKCLIFGVNYIGAVMDADEGVDTTWHVSHAKLLKGQLRIHQCMTSDASGDP